MMRVIYSKSFTITNLNADATYQFQAQIVDSLETVTSGVITVTALPIFDMSKTDFNFNVPVCVNKAGSAVLNEVRVKNNDQSFALHLAASGNKGLWDYTNDNWIIARKADNKRVIIQDDLSVNNIYTNGINSYSNGETTTYNSAFVDYAGHTSNSGKDLIFSVRTNRSMDKVSNLSVTACKLVVRMPNGYIKVGTTQTDASGYDFYNDSNATIQVVKYDAYNFYVRITMNAAFTNLPNNNCCVSVTCAGMTVRFNT